MNPEYAHAPFHSSLTNQNDVLDYIAHEVRELTDNGKRKLLGDDVRVFYERIRFKFSENIAYAVIATRVFFMLSDNARDEFSKRLYRKAASEIAAQTEVNLQVNGLRQRIIAKTAAPGASHEIVGALSELNPLKCKRLLDDAFRFADDPCATNVVKIAKLGEFHQPLLRAAFTQNERESRIAACSALASVATAAAAGANIPPRMGTNPNATTRENLRVEAARIEQAILKASEVCVALPAGEPNFQFTRQRMEVLVETLAEAAVAAGILEWATMSLHAPRADELKFVIPKISALVHLIGERHERKVLRKQALHVLHTAFLRQWDDQQDDDAVQQCQVLLVNALVGTTKWWMAADLAKLIYAYYLRDERIDSSHIRNLVIGILQSMEPPYTLKLCEFMVPVLTHPRVESVLNQDGKQLRHVFMREANRLDAAHGRRIQQNSRGA